MSCSLLTCSFSRTFSNSCNTCIKHTRYDYSPTRYAATFTISTRSLPSNCGSCKNSSMLKSSIMLFCNGVPDRSNLWPVLKHFKELNSFDCRFFKRCPSSTTINAQGNFLNVVASIRAPSNDVRMTSKRGRVFPGFAYNSYYRDGTKRGDEGARCGPYSCVRRIPGG